MNSPRPTRCKSCPTSALDSLASLLEPKGPRRNLAIKLRVQSDRDFAESASSMGSHDSVTVLVRGRTNAGPNGFPASWILWSYRFFAGGVRCGRQLAREDTADRSIDIRVVQPTQFTAN